MAQEKAGSNGGAAAAENGKNTKLDLANQPSGSEAAKSASPDATQESAIQVAQSHQTTLHATNSGILEVYATMLNNRPIASSNLQVVDYSVPGHRPVFASTMVVRDDLTLPGGRPVMMSDPKLIASSLLPGGRPIASNEIDDAMTLMGFLD